VFVIENWEGRTILNILQIKNIFITTVLYYFKFNLQLKVLLLSQIEGRLRIHISQLMQIYYQEFGCYLRMEVRVAPLTEMLVACNQRTIQIWGLIRGVIIDPSKYY